jgi:hypothetical protein
LLNFLSYGGTGQYQVDQAIAAVGTGISNLKFVVVDVEEECCVTKIPWQANIPYKKGSEIVDSNNNMQYAISGGKSGSDAPPWNDKGGLTKDGTGTLVWRNLGKPINQTDSVMRIREAVSEIEKLTKKAVIYTDRDSWKTITGGCGTGQANNCADLIALPLWDVEHRKVLGSDGTIHCGDGIPGLGFFTPYPNFGWQVRSGNQYDFGLAAPGADWSHLRASLMEETPSKNSPCNGEALFGISVDLDAFDPALFQ